MFPKDFDFEKTLKELEQIANQLENTQTSLDDSIILFEKGVKLSKDCSDYLETAKQKIITLSQLEEECATDD